MTRYGKRNLKYSLNENFNLLPYVEWDRFVTQALEFQTPPFFLIWTLPRLWYGSLSGSISLNHLSIFYNILCYNSPVLLTAFVSRSSCRFTINTVYIHKGKKQSSKYEEGILASTRYFKITLQF